MISFTGRWTAKKITMSFIGSHGAQSLFLSLSWRSVFLILRSLFNGTNLIDSVLISIWFFHVRFRLGKYAGVCAKHDEESIISTKMSHMVFFVYSETVKWNYSQLDCQWALVHMINELKIPNEKEIEKYIQTPSVRVFKHWTLDVEMLWKNVVEKC